VGGRRVAEPVLADILTGEGAGQADAVPQRSGPGRLARAHVPTHPLGVTGATEPQRPPHAVVESRRVRPRRPADIPPVTLRDLSDTHGLISVHGPYAWELMSRATTPDMLGVPYLGFFLVPDWDALVLRAGKTGEYGYDVLAPRARLGEVAAALRAAGDDMDLVDLSVEELDLAVLENGFFSIRLPGVTTLTPVHLQLQWRIDTRRDFPGVAALRAAQADPPPRACWLLGPADAPLPAPDAPITGDAAGRLLVARRSPVLGRAVGFGLVAHARAHPGQRLRIDGQDWVTVTSPLLTNRSLFIDTQRHAWEGRAGDAFPPLRAASP
jgi:glycine cleavage system aminomethyltransferase T